MVDAVGSGTTYTCNITGMIPSEFQGLSTGEYVILLISVQSYMYVKSLII